MPDPVGLLHIARQLTEPGTPSFLLQDRFRRAISTAYYALFHKIAEAAAERFMGAGARHTVGYALFYRAFDHRKMKDVCEGLRGETLKGKYRTHLRRTAVSQDLRDFAGAFASLQEARHAADYDPSALFLLVDASSLVDSAEVAMQAFDRASPDERDDLMALMLLGARA